MRDRGNDDFVGAYADLKLVQRQDLLSVVRGLIEPTEDTLRLDLAIENEKVVCVLRTFCAHSSVVVDGDDLMLLFSKHKSLDVITTFIKTRL